MKTVPFEVEGTVTHITDLLQIQRKSSPDLFKRTLTIEKDDGQKLFLEIINGNLKMLEKEFITPPCRATVDFVFRGSVKNDKRYNNLHIRKIQKL